MGRVKVKATENLSETNVKYVISLLETENPVTKKEACSILNISYNTTRLGNIIQQHKDDLKFRKDMRKKLRGTPVSEQEEANIVASFLEGSAYTLISNSTYRSITLIKEVLEKNNIPSRDSDADYFKPLLLPDENPKEWYNKGDLIYSARYNAPAIINRLFSKKGDAVYNIRILGVNQQCAYQPYYELGDLTHIQHKLGTLFND